MAPVTFALDASAHENQALLQEALLNCAREPIHHIGSIQDNGVLIAIGVKDGLVQAVSANIDKLLAISPEEALGQSLETLLGPEPAHYLHTLVKPEPDTGPALGSLKLPRDYGPLLLDIQVYRTAAHIVLEIERESPSAEDVFHTLFVPIRDALWCLDGEQDMARYAEAVVRQVRLLTGFDRVMMYRFDDNWDGEVIAESKIDAAASYLGNRFPASDIPAQARALYTKNLVRLIADIDASPIPLLGIQDTPIPVDLGFSWLRSLSPVHVEYLRNMGVRASLSISVVQNGRLWGLIACHHFSPRYVSIRERELDEFIGRSVSLKLIHMDATARHALHGRIRDLLAAITEGIRELDAVGSAITTYHRELIDIVGASGVVLSIEGTEHRLGSVPPPAPLEALLSCLRGLEVNTTFSSTRLSELCPALADHADIASGLLVVPFDADLRSFILWFRPAVLRTLHWAGQPSKILIRDENGGVRLSPRQSFELWSETYRDKSSPWSQVEIDAVNALSLAILKLLTQQALRSREESYRLLAENSTDMIASLDLDGGFRFLSPACRELLGQPAETLLGQRLQDVVHDPDHRAMIVRALNELTVPGSQRTCLVSVGPRWLEVSMKRAQGLRGLDEIVVNARDVTQRYTYQLAIEQVHRRNTRILDASGEALLGLDRAGQIVYANETALRLLGLDADQFGYFHGCDLLCGVDHNPALSQQRCPFLDTLDHGNTQQGFVHFRHQRSGQPVPTHYLCTPLFDNELISGCVIVLTLATSHPNTGQHTDEMILEQTAEAVMVTDAQGRIQSVNRAFTEITGYSADEAVGQTPRLLRSGVHTPNFYQEFWQALEQEQCWRGEIWNRRKNGEIYPQWGSVTAVLDTQGAVKNYIEVFSDISKAKQAEEKLHYMATHDLLTGLPNRMAFSDYLHRAIAQARRAGTSLAVVFIDLDHFKAINDSLGHSVGDSYLTRIADRLLSITRSDDILARWGGDEFVLALQPIADKGLIIDILTRLLSRLAEPILLDGHELAPKASLGVSIYPEDGLIPGDLIKAADAAMYRAKDQGRNRFEFYTAAMQAELDEKFKLTSDLRRALTAGEFILYYQPQVHARTGRLLGLEALIRWRHSERGLLGPIQFIPLAEEIGFIPELGAWVLEEACRQLRAWMDQGVNVPRLAVNVSPLQLKQDFVDLVGCCLKTFGIAPNLLELEITERAFEAENSVRDVLLELRNLGVLLSVDDFGTGHSSLSQIRRIPITCLKIDKSFIDGLPDNSQDLAIVQTIVALGSSLRVDVVAEGVETQAQMHCLSRTGVTHLQGYLFSRPLAPDALLKALRREDSFPPRSSA